MALIIAVAVLTLTVVLALVLRKRTDPKPDTGDAEPEYDEAGYAVAVNYASSFIKTYGGNTYVFLNITIFNKMDIDMEDVDIITKPSLPFINDLKYKATAGKWEVDKKEAVFSDTLQDRALFITAGKTISGYIIVETKKAMCNIDTITVVYKQMGQTIQVAKEKVLMKTVNYRRS